MFAQSCRGRAWRGCPKPRRRSWLRKQSAQALQTAIKTRVVSTGRRGGPSWTTSASGETLERRLWALRNARLPNGFTWDRRSTSTTQARDGQRNPASRSSCRRRCDPCVAACARQLGWAQARQRRTLGCSGSGLDSEPLTLHRAAVPPASADAACPLGLVPVGSDTAGQRKKRCSRCQSHEA